VAVLDYAKFGFYQFPFCLFIVVTVISILLKTTFSQISIQGQLLVKISYRSNKEKTLLRRLKNVGMASEKLYRNTLKSETNICKKNRIIDEWVKIEGFKGSFITMQIYLFFALLSTHKIIDKTTICEQFLIVCDT